MATSLLTAFLFEGDRGFLDVMRDLVRPTLIMIRGFYRKGNVTWFVNSYVPV